MDETLTCYAKFVFHCKQKDSMRQNAYEPNALKIAKQTLKIWMFSGFRKFLGLSGGSCFGAEPVVLKFLSQSSIVLRSGTGSCLLS